MQRPVDRQFYSIDSNTANKSHFQTPSSTQKEKLVENVAESIIGKDKTFSGPFGQRKVVYLDYIASGRAVSFIEDYIQNEVLPEYGNTHTTTSVTSLQTTLFRHEARDIIRNAVNASEHDSVIFTGSGSTGAIHKLIHGLNLDQPPVVLVGPYEHHSNLLPWKEAGAQVVNIQQTRDGLVDLSDLEHQLQVLSGSSRQLIGSFSAASNVTGILCDVDAVSILLHKYGAVAFWDYATAAPYVRLDMNPVVPGKDSALAYKDAMFISPHKFVGGVNTPGVLVVKKKLFRNDVPDECGGGTVFFVRREAHRYLREPELREEGGTPDIVGAIRAGLVFQLKSALTPQLIMEKETYLLRRAVEAWRSVPNLVILGNMEVDRLPVFSFLVHHPGSGLFLHHNFITALLNDLFGIQARGGCACAGPYAMELLGLSEEKAAEIEELLAEDRRLDRVHLRRYTEYSHREILRPGFTRLNLPYFMSEEQLEFVLQAVAMVAEQGWKLLPQYMFNPETGEWRHREQQVFKERKWLGHISYAQGRMEYRVPTVTPKAPLPPSYQDCLSAARQVIAKAEKTKTRLPDHTVMFDEEARPFRWFLLPSEACHILSSHDMTPHHVSTLPFCPHTLAEHLKGAGVTRSNTYGSDEVSTAADMSLSNSKDAVDKQGTGSGIERSGLHGHEDRCPGSSSSHGDGVVNGEKQLELHVRTISEEARTCSSPWVNMPTEPSSCVASFRTAGEAVDSSSGFSQALQQAMERGFCDNGSNPATSEQNRRNQAQEMEIVHPQPMQTEDTSSSFSSSKVTSAAICDGASAMKAGESDVITKGLSNMSSPSLCHDSKKEDVMISPGLSHVPSLSPSDGGDCKETAVSATGRSDCQETAVTSTGDGDYKETGTSMTGGGDSQKQDVATSPVLSSVSTPSPSDGSNLEDSVISSGRGDCRKESVTMPLQVSNITSASPSDSGGCKEEAVKPAQDSPVVTTPVCSSASSSVTQPKFSKKKTKRKPEMSGYVENGTCPLPGPVTRVGRKATASGTHWVSPSKDIFKPTLKAMEEFSMIKDGDRVLVCLSGGKDSLSLLHTLHQYQFYCRGKRLHFELGAVTVDPQTPSYDPSPLKEVLADLGVPYFYESQCIMETAVNLPYECASICSFCSRMKRGRIYAAARREGYNVLALGQHLDDLAESFLMSLFHNGSLRTMKAHYTVQEGDLRVIRPFVYVREKDLRTFAEKNKLPVIAENCPACFEAPKERHRTKQLLASQEILFPRLFSSIMSAIRPIMAISHTSGTANSLFTDAQAADDIDI